MFPVFQKVRENARRTSCASNEKQIGLAFTQYVQDSDEQFPLICTLSQNANWGQEIYPYVKSTGVFQCPDNPANGSYKADGTGSKLDHTSVPPVNGAPILPVSYAYNYQITGSYDDSTNDQYTTNNAQPITLAGVNEPSQKILVTESQGEIGSAYYDWTNGTGGFGSGPGTGRGIASHSGRWNCLFIDGHVKTLLPTATGAPFNMWGNFASNVAADGPNCGAASLNINCDAPSTGLSNALSILEQKYK